MTDILNIVIGYLEYIGEQCRKLLIDNDYVIDDSQEWQEQVKIYVMRYRRIFGLVMLVVLISIKYYCDKRDFDNNVLQNGGKSLIVSQLKKGKLSMGDKFAKSKLGQYNKGLGEMSEKLKEQGLTDDQITSTLRGKKYTDVKNYVGDKLSGFANWLYEILFAIAISIAICMVILPTLSFFILALFCYILLGKKIGSVKNI
jgi:hypothetical protein